MAFLFLLSVTMFWAFVEFGVIKKNYTTSENVSQKAKRNNHWLSFSALVSFSCLYISFFYHWNNDIILPVFWVGGVVAIIGIVFRKMAIITLQEHFDGLIQVKDKQELIQHGLYRYLRHPSYTGTLITFFGFGICSMNAGFAVLFPLLFWICYKFRIQLEETVLLTAFGAKYERYQEATWGMLPWFKRKKVFKKNETL